MLDTNVYEVELGDGTIVTFAADVIAECMYAYCDVEGNSNAEGDSMCYWMQLWSTSWTSQL